LRSPSGRHTLSNVTRVALVLLALLLVGAPAAAAQTAVVGRAADELRADPVYVDPGAQAPVDADDAAALRDRISGAGGGIFIAVLPAEAGDADSVLRELASDVGRPGTYVVVVGTRLRAASNRPGERVGAIADDAVRAHQGEGPDGIAPALDDIVAGVAAARGGGDVAAGGEDDGDGSSGAGLGIVAAIAAGAAGLFFFRRRRRQAAAFSGVRETAEEDLVALGDDIRALDLDVEMPGVDARAREDYGRALSAYERASDAFRRARHPADLEEVSASLEEGRYAMTAAKARLEGREPPERRPPCFFDPRHGPSVRDVEWAPPGGEPRPVPACAADAIRVEEGEEPQAREVLVGGRRTPYWNAGPAYGPWAGGFFGGAAGSLLPLLFVGSMLGSSFGWGAPVIADDDAGFDDSGDIGGGDFDVGGGDFGGGDFGGGDF
jgi:hypothetical protein